MGVRMCIITDIRDSEKILLASFYFCFFRFSFSLSSLFLCFLFLSFKERILCLTLEERQGMLERERERRNKLFRWWTIDASCVSIFASREGFSRCETAVPFSWLMDFRFGERGR